jgi:hypothetical protein
MKKYIAICLFVVTSFSAYAQKVITRTGEIKFEASVPAFEEIAAKNNTVSCIFDLTKGELVSLALVKAFRFKIPLMEEHFNENYMESTKYPKATFKGVVKDFDASKLTTKKSAYDLDGELTIHGVTKKIKTKIIVSKISEKIEVSSLFYIIPQDYSVEIPSIVKNKISEKVKIILNFILESK